MAKAQATGHPARHPWQLMGDFVLRRNRRQITQIERQERCFYCPRERITKIDVIRWEIIGRHYKGKNLPMSERLPTARDLERSIRESTTIPELRGKVK